MQDFNVYVSIYSYLLCRHLFKYESFIIRVIFIHKLRKNYIDTILGWIDRYRRLVIMFYILINLIKFHSFAIYCS